METLLLNQDQIKSLVTLDEIIDAVEKTFRGLGDGTVTNPSKVNLDLGEKGPYPPYEGFMNGMPAYIGWADVAGLKWVGGFLGDRAKMKLPYITAMIMLIDPKLGTFTSVMDGAWITNIRTGAQTAVALTYMLPEGKKRIRIGLYGAGMQGRTQVMAISRRFIIDEVVVYDINPDAAKRYAASMQEYVAGKITVAATPKEAATGDAIIMVTQAEKPYLEKNWVQPGTIVFPLSSYQECTNECILACDTIIVDHLEQALHRGSLASLVAAGRLTEKDIFATIGDLVAGKASARVTPEGITLCVALGTGCMDIAVASIVQKRAKERGVGSSFAFV